MDKEKLNKLIERLYKAEKKERNVIVNEAAKENGIKEKEVWKLLIDAGFNPKETQPPDQQNNTSVTPRNDQQDKSLVIPRNDQQSDSGKKSVLLRHKTEYQHYRRAGLVLNQKAAAYEITDEQLAILKKDTWVVISENEKEGDSDKEDGEGK